MFGLVPLLQKAHSVHHRKNKISMQQHPCSSLWLALRYSWNNCFSAESDLYSSIMRGDFLQLWVLKTSQVLCVSLSVLSKSIQSEEVGGSFSFPVFLKGNIYFGLRNTIVAIFLRQERPHLGRLFHETAGENESSSVLFSFLFAWFCSLSFHHEPACGHLSKQGGGMKRLTFALGKGNCWIWGIKAWLVALPGCWELQEGRMQPEKSRWIWGILPPDPDMEHWLTGFESHRCPQLTPDMNLSICLSLFHFK